MMFFHTVAVSALLLFSVVVAQTDICVNTAEKCHCMPTDQSGTCTRPQGDGACLLSPCSSGYRCDCFGYEMCSVTRCGKYEAQPGETQSETVPFRCSLEQDKADCLAIYDVLDTESAAKHAQTEASASNDECTASEVYAAGALDVAQTDKKVMNQMLSDVWRLSVGLNKSELDAISASAAGLEGSISEISTSLTIVTGFCGKIFNRIREVRLAKRDAVINGRQARLGRKELEDEEKLAVKDEAKVGTLRIDIAKYDDAQKNAARTCANLARKGRQWRNEAIDAKGACMEAASRGKKAFDLCMALCQAALDKVSAAAGSLSE